MTGAGKSNTVSVLINQLLSYNVPVFVFDMHGEYKGAQFPNGDVNVIKPKINPKFMTFYEIKKLVNISSNAYIQERHFRMAFKEAKKRIEDGVAHEVVCRSIYTSFRRACHTEVLLGFFCNLHL